MRRVRKPQIIAFVALLVVVATIGYLLRWTPIVANQVAAAFTENLLRDRGYRLEIAQVKGDPRHGLVLLAPRLIAEREAEEVVAQARSLSVRVDPWGLLRGRVSVHSLELDKPLVRFGPGGIRRDLVESNVSRGPRAPVPRFHIAKLVILDGRFEVRQQEQPAFVVEDIGLNLRLDSNTREVSVDLRDCNALFTGRGVEVQSAAGRLIWADDSLRVERLSLVSPHSRLRAAGWFHPQSLQLALQCEVDSFALSELDHWVQLPVTGVVQGPCRVAWLDEELKAEGRWSGVWEEHDVSQMRFNLSWNLERFALPSGVGWFDGMPVEVALQVDSLGAVKGSAQFRDVDLQNVHGFEGFPSSDLQGRVEFSTGAADSLHMQIQLQAGVVAGWPIDTARGQVSWWNGNTRISSATVRRGATVLRLAGLVENEELQVDFSAFSDSVGVALSPLQLEDADAMVELQGSIVGSLQEPHINARGLLQAAHWQDMRASQVEFELDAVLPETEHDVLLQLRGQDVVYRGHRSDRANATLQWVPGALRIRRASVARADTMVAIAAVYRTPKRDWQGDVRASRQLNLETALMQVGLREIRIEEPATLWWTDNAVHVDSLRFVSRGGRLRLDGGFDLTSSRIDGRAEVEDFDLEFLSSFAPWEHVAVGRGTGWFEAHGDLDRTQVDARLRILDGSWNSLPFDSLQVEVQSDAFSVELRRLQLGTPFGELNATGRLGYLPAVRRWVQGRTGSRDAAALASASLAARIDLSEMQLDRAWMARRNGLIDPEWQARVTAHVEVQGTLEEPRFALSGAAQEVVLPELRADSLRAVVDFAEERLSVRDFVMQVGEARVMATGVLPVHGSLLSKPVLQRDEPVAAHVELPRSSFAVVQRLLTVFEAVPQGVPVGEIEGELSVTGSLRDPVLEGSMQAHAVGFTFAGMEEVYEGVDALGTFHGNTLALRDISGRIGKEGQVSGIGELRFGGLAVQGYHFDLQARGVLIHSVPQVLALVNGQLAVDGRTLRGDTVVPEFSGALQVQEAIITQEFGGGGDASGVLASTDLPEWLADVTLDFPGNVWIKNSTADMELEGSLQALRTTAGLSVSGLASIKRGSYSLYLENFEITRGELDFNRSSGFQPEMDIEGRQGRPGSRVYVHLTGTPPDNLRWTLTSDRGETSDQLQQAMLLREPKENAFNVGSTVVERIFQDLEFIESFHIDPANDSLATQDAALVPFNVSAGKAISDRVFLVYTQGLNESDINQKVSVEIDIVRGLLLASSYTRRNIPDSSTNRSQNAFDIDLKFRYEY